MVRVQYLKDRAAWLKARQSYIGGSDAAALVGMSPYKTNQDLYKEKTGQIDPKDISEVDCVQYGIHAEDHLRELFKLDFPMYEVHYGENNLWTNDAYPFAAASLDGWLRDRRTGKWGILEIKTTEIRKAGDRLKWRNGIPDHYYCQAIWYLGVTGFDFVILKAQIKTVFGDDETDFVMETRHYYIERNELVGQDIVSLFQKGAEFAENVKSGRTPNLALHLADPKGLQEK